MWTDKQIEEMREEAVEVNAAFRKVLHDQRASRPRCKVCGGVVRKNYNITCSKECYTEWRKLSDKLYDLNI